MRTFILVKDGHDTLSGFGETTYKWIDQKPAAIAIVCQKCGDLWCWMAPDEHSGFYPISGLCRGCGGGLLSAFQFHYRDFTIPDELLAREVEVYEQNHPPLQPWYYV